MKLLLEIMDEDVGEKSSKKEIAILRVSERTAARAILLKGNKIALLNVTKEGYHKLPGGGAEGKETIEDALHREILEETGCTIRVISEVGKVIEHRSRYGLVQTSYCFIAEAIHEVKPNFDEGERNAGYKLEWTGINSAIDIVSKEKPDDYEGKFIVKRDLAFLKAALPKIR
jgi:8-oxo-dGTP diphosphatase